jgi:uncharacterized protein (TIGR02001 family)
MLNKKLLNAAAAAALLASFGGTSAQAADDFAIAGNIALTSDYRFRGISQTDESPAVQGGFDASFEPGFYIGTWGSSVDFSESDNDTGHYGSLELDYYGGWRGPIGDSDFGIDVGYLYYDYPGDTVDPKGDYQEVSLKGSWKGLTLGVNYSDDYYAKTGEFWYYAADYSYSFIPELALGLHAGYNDFENDKSSTFLFNEEKAINGLDQPDHYTDYSVSLTYTWAGVGFTLAYVGTDLDKEDYYGTNLGEDTAVLSIKKSL